MTWKGFTIFGCIRYISYGQDIERLNRLRSREIILLVYQFTLHPLILNNGGAFLLVTFFAFLVSD